MNRLALLSLGVGLPGGLAISRAGEPAPALDGVAFFEQKIRTVLVERCLKCHRGGPTGTIKGGLRLDSRAAIRKGGDGGPDIVPGDPESRTYRHAGRDFRLTEVHGRVVEEILA